VSLRFVNKAPFAQKALTETRIFRERSSLDRTVARQIARELEVQTEEIGHCAIYEDELQRIWPLNEENRKAKIAQFATEYGFKLSFYKQGAMRHHRERCADQNAVNYWEINRRQT
jgi:hypothetical protein